MLASSENFPEQFSRVQQQFKEWSYFDQLYATVELTRTFDISYRHFLCQLLQTHILNENSHMFNHIVDDANSPDIVTCLLSNPLDKILNTLLLYLPLISTTTTTTINEKLLEAYRDVLSFLDLNLLNSTKFSSTEQQLIHCCQQILFFIQTNSNLKRLISHIPKVIHLVQTKKFQSEEQQQQPYHQPLQRHSSIRSQGQPLKNFVSDGVHAALTQQLTRLETNDSGVDLTEPLVPLQIHNFLSAHHSQHSFIDRTHSGSLSSHNKHTFVGKTASSPIPEHGTLNIPVRMPLKGVLSAPSPTTYSDYRHKNSNYQQFKHRSTLAKSDEDEQESQEQNNDSNYETNQTTENTKRLGQFYSFSYRNRKSNQNTEDVSQYLGVDAHSIHARNTFMQPNSGMKDVPKWLKYLRLHKYDVFFSQMTYDYMMNLTIEQLKELNITDGACAKIILNIKKLKERSVLLIQLLTDIDNGQIELSNVIVQLTEILSTPIRSKQQELENNSEEDLPKLIIQILEKIYQQLTPNSSSEICNSLLGLFDRCYRHEAFIDTQRHLVLQWRGRLSAVLQSLGRIEFKTIQSTLSHTPQRRITKPSVRPMKSSSGPYYSNYASNTTPLTKFNSEPQNNNNHLMETNLIRRPNKSPIHIYPTTEELNDNNLHTSFTCITSTPQRHNGGYLADNQHQALTRKASIDPYGETNNNNRTKLCKTFSDPSKIRFHNPMQMNHMQLSSMRSQQLQQKTSFHMISSPYSQQQRQFSPRSPPTSTTDTSTSPIKECYTDDERSDYYGNNNDTTSISRTSDTNELENTDDQRHNNIEMDSFCHEVTEQAISDDVHDVSVGHAEEIWDVSNIKHSSDTEQ